jgi:hypothetical protein
MSRLLLPAHGIYNLILRLLQMLIAALAAIQAIEGLKQSLVILQGASELRLLLQ